MFITICFIIRITVPSIYVIKCLFSLWNLSNFRIFISLLLKNALPNYHSICKIRLARRLSICVINARKMLVADFT